MPGIVRVFDATPLAWNLRSAGRTLRALHTDFTDLPRQALLGVSPQAFQSTRCEISGCFYGSRIDGRMVQMPNRARRRCTAHHFDAAE